MDNSLTVQISNIITSVCKNSADVEVMVNGSLLVFVVKKTYMYITSIEGNDLRFGFSYSKLVSEKIEYAELLADDFIFDKVQQVYLRYQNILNSRNPSVQIPDLRAFDEYINKTEGLKSTDGAKFIFITSDDMKKRYIYPVYTGYPVTAKSDGLGLSIYDLDYTRYLGVTSIYKKKLKKRIDLFVRYVNLDRPLRSI